MKISPHWKSAFCCKAPLPLSNINHLCNSFTPKTNIKILLSFFFLLHNRFTWGFFQKFFFHQLMKYRFFSFGFFFFSFLFISFIFLISLIFLSSQLLSFLCNLTLTNITNTSHDDDPQLLGSLVTGETPLHFMWPHPVLYDLL